MISRTKARRHKVSQRGIEAISHRAHRGTGLIVNGKLLMVNEVGFVGNLVRIYL